MPDLLAGPARPIRRSSHCRPDLIRGHNPSRGKIDAPDDFQTLDERGRTTGPVQQQLLRHPGRLPLQAGQPAGARRHRLQRADHPRLRGRLGREGAARRPVAGPLAGPRRHGDPARLQQHRPRDPRVHSRELHRLHGLRHRVPRHRHPGQGALRDRARGAAGDDPRTGRPRDVPHPVVEDQEVLRRPQEEGAARRHVQDHHRPAASARAAPSASPSATTTP